MSQIHIKKNSKIIFPFAHILMYTVLGVKTAYIRGKGFKIHVQQIKHVFWDDIGNIKGIKKLHGVQRIWRGMREGHTSVIHWVW